MGLNSSPERDDPAKHQTSRFGFAGLESPPSVPDRSYDWKENSQASQKGSDFSLPELYFNTAPRGGLPPERPVKPDTLLPQVGRGRGGEGVEPRPGRGGVEL